MSWPRNSWTWVSHAAFCSCVLACGGYSHTPRIVAGKPIDDRAISTDAYAAYVHAAQLEARGDTRAALAAYETAKSHDSASAEIQTRIAKLTCQLDPGAANEPFEEALELDPSYAGAWREWASCELRRGNLTRALRMAKRGVTHAPESLEATLTVVSVLEARKEPEAALQQLVGFVTLYPEYRLAWLELYATAQRQGDAAWSHRAARVLGRELAPERQASSVTPEELVRRALLEGGLERARNVAVEQGIGPLALAWLALDLGRAPEAARQAELVLGANPDDLEAALLALTAHHAAGSSAGLTLTLDRVPRGDPTQLSERALLGLRQVLAERIGLEAALAFEERIAPGPGKGRATDLHREDGSGAR